MQTIFLRSRSGQERQISDSNLSGRSLMEIIRDSGSDEILAVCGGCCSCSTCHIYIDESDWGRLPPMGRDEDDLLEATDCRTEFSRLSCQVPFADPMDGIKITIAPEG